MANIYEAMRIVIIFDTDDYLYFLCKNYGVAL